MDLTSVRDRTMKKALIIYPLCALALTMLATDARAAKPLVLTSGETAVANGSAATVGLGIDGCTLYSKGTINGNGTGIVRVMAVKNSYVSCPEGSSASGTITEAQLNGAGKVTLKGKITISLPGPCIYTFGKFKSTFEIPGEAGFINITEGKLNRRTSSTSCEASSTAFWIGDITDEPFNGSFQTAA
jgi:hypothetical protein